MHQIHEYSKSVVANNILFYGVLAGDVVCVEERQDGGRCGE